MMEAIAVACLTIGVMLVGLSWDALRGQKPHHPQQEEPKP